MMPFSVVSAAMKVWAKSPRRMPEAPRGRIPRKAEPVICSVCKDRPVRFFQGRLYVQCCVCGPDKFERRLREKMPQSISVLEWATYNQWASEQRTAHEKKNP